MITNTPMTEPNSTTYDSPVKEVFYKHMDFQGVCIKTRKRACADNPPANKVPRFNQEDSKVCLNVGLLHSYKQLKTPVILSPAMIPPAPRLPICFHQSIKSHRSCFLPGSLSDQLIVDDHMCSETDSCD